MSQWRFNLALSSSTGSGTRTELLELGTLSGHAHQVRRTAETGGYGMSKKRSRRNYLDRHRDADRAPTWLGDRLRAWRAGSASEVHSDFPKPTPEEVEEWIRQLIGVADEALERVVRLVGNPHLPELRYAKFKNEVAGLRTNFGRWLLCLRIHKNVSRGRTVEEAE